MHVINAADTVLFLFFCRVHDLEGVMRTMLAKLTSSGICRSQLRGASIQNVRIQNALRQSAWKIQASPYVAVPSSLAL